MKFRKKISLAACSLFIWLMHTQTASAQATDLQIAHAKSGDAQAQYELGMCYRSGRCGNIDYALALTWLQKAADQGLADAQLKVGEIYLGGYGATIDKPLAMQWLLKSAEQKNGKAQYGLWQVYNADIWFNGNGAKAAEWAQKAKSNLLKASKNGDPEAQLDLYELTLQTSFETNPDGSKSLLPPSENLNAFLNQAIGIFAQQAKDGDMEASLALQIAQMFAPQAGKTVATEDIQSTFVTAANKGMVTAQYYLGSMAADKKDYPTAVKYLTLAANQNYAQAQVSLGLEYLYGHGVEKNTSRGLDWITQAAQSGSIPAQIMLADLYSDRFGENIIPADGKMALEWYEKAAIHGNALAMLRLAVLYTDGAIVNKDTGLAKAWLIKMNEVVEAHSSSVLDAVSDRDDIAKLGELQNSSPELEQAGQAQARSIQLVFP
jgi:TPR repeat protein